MVGAGARLGPGVIVGDRATIAAGAVVDPSAPVPTDGAVG